MNNKTTPNQMRILLRRMRGEAYVSESKGTTKHELSMRDMLKITRSLNEDIEEPTKPENMKTAQDQQNEEEKFLNFFGNEVNVEFIDLEVTDKYVFWGGTINGIIQFIYKVTPDEATSGVEFNYLEDFNPDNPDNDEIIKKVESYYNTFYEYWSDSVIQKTSDEQ
jgi:hypothetical protein